MGAPVSLVISTSSTGSKDPSSWTYQWSKNGVTIDGASSSRYVIAEANSNDAGTYSVKASNSVGASVASTSVTVKPLAAPVIVTSPSAIVCYVGQAATFSVSATGSYPRNYQWRKDGATIAGATLTYYTIPAAALTDVGAYSVAITNSLGSATSGSGSLTVNAAIAPVIYSYAPYDTTVTQGGSGSLSVSLSAGTSPYTFQWKKDGVALTNGTASTLSFPAVALSDAGKYSVTVSNVAGSATSREAVVSVTPATPVSISSGPQSASVYLGQSASFYVNVNSNAPVSYQWLRDGAAITDATNSSYTIPSAAYADAGLYAVRVSNIVSAATSSSATLSVLAPVPPSIATDVKDLSVSSGDYPNFSVIASGTAPFGYQWYYNGNRVVGATNSSYSFSATTTNSGSYSVLVTNSVGFAMSRTATLTVAPPARPTVAKLSNQTVALGTSFSFSASYYNYNNTPTYQWYRNGTVIAGATNSSYGSSAATLQDAGDYFVVITNSAGSTTSWTGRLTVTGASTVPAGAWLAAVRAGDVLYFCFANPARVERYNLATESWLSSVSLGHTPTAFMATSNYLFVASGSTVYRYAIDGTAETFLNSAFDATITGLAVYGNYLLASSGSSSASRLTALQIGDGAKISSSNYIYYWSATMAEAPSLGRVFSRTSGISPSDIVYATISATGQLSPSPSDSAYHGDFPDASLVYVFPSETYVAENSGIVYTAADLKYAGSLGGAFDDLTFDSGGNPVVLRGNKVVMYSSAFVETAQIPVSNTPARIFMQGQKVYAFEYPATGGSIGVKSYKVSDAIKPTLPVPLDPTNLDYVPDTTFLDQDGVLYLYSKVYGQIFRWSSSTAQYLTSIPLQGWPNYITYSSTNRRIYLGYCDARVLQIKLDQGSAVEEAFATVPQQVIGLSTAGEYVFVADPSGAWMSYYLYAPDGRLTATRDWSYLGAEYVWDPVLRRMYQYRDDTSPNDLLYTEITTAGTFGNQVDTPYHGDITTRYPIRVTPDGSAILLGSGKFYDAYSLLVNNSLANTIDDAAWMGGRLYTARALSGGTEVQSWAQNNYQLVGSRTISGDLLRIYRVTDNQLLVISSLGGRTLLTSLLSDLRVKDGGNVSSYVGTYFGSVGVNGTGGEFGFVVRSDGTGGFIANLSASNSAVIASGFAIQNDGSFYATGSDVAIGTPQILSGKITTNGSVAGTVGATNLAFSGTRTSTNTEAGFFRATALNGTVGAAYVIGTKNGRGIVVVNQGSSVDGGTGTVDADGEMTVTTKAGTAITVTLDLGSSSVAASTSQGSLATATYAGLLDGVVRTDRLANISTRGWAGTGDETLTAGFVVTGAANRSVLIRAVGQPLTNFGVSGVMADPALTLYRGDSAIGRSDNWRNESLAASLPAIAARVGAFELPATGTDAELYVSLEPNGYTTQVSAATGASGIALVEVYDAGDSSTASGPRVVNISTRGRASSGDGALIAGFVISGNSPKRVLLRGIGPGLANFKVSGVLANPVLTLMSGATTVTSNDDWATQTGSVTASDLMVAMASVGAFSLSPTSKDATLLLTLKPGGYTALVTGKNGASGIALVEVYELSN